MGTRRFYIAATVQVVVSSLKDRIQVSAVRCTT